MYYHLNKLKNNGVYKDEREHGGWGLYPFGIAIQNGHLQVMRLIKERLLHFNLEVVKGPTDQIEEYLEEFTCGPSNTQEMCDFLENCDVKDLGCPDFFLPLGPDVEYTRRFGLCRFQFPEVYQKILKNKDEIFKEIQNVLIIPGLCSIVISYSPYVP